MAPDFQACGDPAPLCLYVQFKHTTNLYITFSIFTVILNFAYGVIIGGLVFAISTEKGRRLEARAAVVRLNKKKRDKSYSPQERLMMIVKRKKDRLENAQDGLNITFFVWILVIVEVCVLTPESIVKYFFTFHFLHLWSVGQVQFAFSNAKQQKYAFWVNPIAMLFSLGGFIPSVMYLVWNCTEGSSQSFVNTSGCETTLNGARYILVLNIFPFLLGTARILLHHIWLRDHREMQTPDVYEQMDTTGSKIHHNPIHAMSNQVPRTKDMIRRNSIERVPNYVF
jgi:hypothetical protein